MGSDKRTQPRIDSALSVRLRHARRDGSGARTLQNVSVGGIACYSDEPVPNGERVAVEMAIGEQHFQLQGRVVWCRGGAGGRYELGLRFEEEPGDSRERLCHDLAAIEHYRHEVLMLEGRQLSSDAAALEWINAGGAHA